MRRTATTIIMLYLLVMISIGQNMNFLDGYKYVYVNTLTYQDGSVDTYGITGLIRDQFTEKGFTLLSTDTKNWPTDAIGSPCLILYCTLSHTYDSFAGITVSIKLSNCDKKIVYNQTGNQFIANPTAYYYQKAANKAFYSISHHNYVFNSSLTPVFNFPTVEQTNESEESIKAYLTSNKLDPIEGIYKSFESNDISFYKFGVVKRGDKYKAIVIESSFSQWKVGEVKAYFEPSSMKGIYSAKWYWANKTLLETYGLMNNEAMLSIELNDTKAGVKTQSKFIKLFPAISGEQSSKKDNSKASGSGFFITSDGIIATNAHVIEDASNIEITFTNEIGSFTHKAKILLTDAKNDVALLKIDDDKFKGFNSIPYGINEKAETGEKVFTIGYPLNDVMGTNYKVNDGIISSKSGIADDVRYYQISVPLQPGNSGGPLFSKEGNVIGITSARLNGEAVGTKVENVNYAIKASYLLNLYNMLPNSSKLISTSQVANKELQEQVKVLKNYVCLIRIF